MKTGTRVLVAALAVAIVSAFVAQAQTKTSVAGTWKMNKAKSKFGSEGGGPEAITIRFEQQEGTIHEWLTIGGPQGERTIELNYKTDGKQAPTQIDAQDMQTMAKWEGESLLLVITEPSGATFSRKFTIGDGGKTMMIAVHHSGDGGDRDDSVFLEKQ